MEQSRSRAVQRKTEGNETMIATAVTLAFLGLTISAIVSRVRRDADKIAAALAGNSWLAQPRQTFRPVTVRYAPRPVTVATARRPSAMRAAA
jgi:hypothetical protein